MPDEPRPDVDRRLRGAFGDDPAAVARIVEGALARSTTAPNRGWLRLVAGAAAVCIAAALVFWPSPPATEPKPPPTLSLSGSFTDGLLAVSLPDGSTSITSAGAREDRPPDGYGIVLVEGEIK
jgi:hypothetical protein